MLEELLDEAHPGDRTIETAAVMLAGIDRPEEEERIGRLVAARGWAAHATVSNDTFALLRAGTDRGWGVAVVCGAGINCVGVAPDGRVARFVAYGPVSGDWGGGSDVGLAAVSAAVRSEDGRGPKTALENVVPATFGLERPSDLTEALHRGRIPMEELLQLPPVVFAAAPEDPEAARIVEQVAEEAVAFVRVALQRLDLAGKGAETILGGGLMQSRDPLLTGTIRKRLSTLDPSLEVRVADSPPVVGAVLLALDRLGTGAEALETARRELDAAVAAGPAVITRG